MLMNIMVTRPLTRSACSVVMMKMGPTLQHLQACYGALELQTRTELNLM